MSVYRPPKRRYLRYARNVSSIRSRWLHSECCVGVTELPIIAKSISTYINSDRSCRKCRPRWVSFVKFLGQVAFVNARVECEDFQKSFTWKRATCIRRATVTLNAYFFCHYSIVDFFNARYAQGFWRNVTLKMRQCSLQLVIFFLLNNIRILNYLLKVNRCMQIWHVVFLS